VYWPSGSCVVALDSLTALHGDRLPRAVRVLLEEHVLLARQAWEELNG